MEAIEECARLGVPVVTALANGFGETGAEGAAREARITADAQGVRHAPGRPVEPRRGRPAAQDLSHRQRRLRRAGPAGRPHLRRFALRRHDRHVSVARQGARHRVSPAWSLSATRSICRSARFARRRSKTRASTATSCSSKPCARPRRCGRFALEAAARNKPVLAYKLGRSAAARELAVSHTGALAGEDDIADVFLRECGIARVDTLEGLIEGFPLLARVPARRRGARAATVAVVTTTAGGATMVVDPLGEPRHRGRAAERRRRSRGSRRRPASKSRRRGSSI